MNVLTFYEYILTLVLDIQSFYIYIYIYIYIRKKKPNFFVCDRCEHQKITYLSIQIYFGTVFPRQYMCVCERYMLKI